MTWKDIFGGFISLSCIRSYTYTPLCIVFFVHLYIYIVHSPHQHPCPQTRQLQILPMLQHHHPRPFPPIHQLRSAVQTSRARDRATMTRVVRGAVIPIQDRAVPTEEEENHPLHHPRRQLHQRVVQFVEMVTLVVHRILVRLAVQVGDVPVSKRDNR